MCWNSRFSIGITASIWTVIQTSFHIIWALCGYYFYVCKIKPTYYGLVILYLTYFYKGECGNITLKEDEIFASDDTEIDKRFILETNTTDDEDVYDIIQTILDKGILPNESSAAYRTHVYFHAFIISDAAWIISAFLLFAGTCFQIKKCLSLMFYCPWLVVSTCVILLDVVSAVHFGLDILTIHNFTSWLKFIGVENYNDFAKFNEHSLSYIIPLIPALFLCILFSRGLVFWIWNIVLFVQVLNIAVLAFQDNLDGNKVKRHSKTGRIRNSVQDLNLDSSSSRIRNWQLFYGAIDTSSSSSSKSSDRDFNSNNTMRRTSTKVKISDMRIFPNVDRSPENSDSYEKYVMSIMGQSSRLKPDVSTYYHGYTDVAESFDHTLGTRADSAANHTSQLSWTYFKPLENGKKLECHLKSTEGESDRQGVQIQPTATCIELQ